MIINITILILAAFFKAVADTLQHHFDTSIFRNYDYKWWDPNRSWRYIKFIPLTKYRPDAWHLANSLMIISFICLAVFYKPHFKWWIEIMAAGILFNLAFGLFYDKTLNKK